ncbi:MATE family efflux transporter [Enterovibrio coralii]|uniref:MATE family efflux transporter n=1 Tax=Enterovibrio coralii TaxID=294935 RepID=UPI000AED2CDB|nr:MATE family efflux transporter [Enterovibrio coralii]
MTPHLYSLVSEYINPLFFGMPLLSFVLIANASLMAKGVMVKPMIVMAIGGLTNLIFDYLLIFGMGSIPAMGLFGAALATVLSWAVMLFMMLVLLSKENLLPSKQIPVPSKTALKEDLLSVFTLSTPAIAAQVLTPISVAVITRLVSDHGEQAVAAYGIVTRIESLALTGILALSVIVTPLVAQNYGAYRQGNLSFLRLDNVIALSGRMTVYWGVICYLVLALVGEHFIALFTSNTDIIRIGYQYLLIVGLSFPAFGLVLITASFFNGVQLPSLSLKLTLVKSLLLTLPLAAVGAYFSASWIWASLAVANVLGAVYAGKLLYRWLAEQETSLTEANASIMGDYLSDLKLLGRKLSRQKSV